MDPNLQQGLAHHRAGRLEEAEACYRLSPDSSAAASNLGVILRITGRLEEAESTLRRALAGAPANMRTRHTLGMTLLQAGKYSEGWRHYEARHDITTRPTPSRPPPVWRGESLRGKRILVVGEQGLGDQILFSRFIPLLAAISSEVIFATSRTLVRLFQPLPARVFNPNTWEGVEADVWTSLGSVPCWLEVGPADAPAPELAFQDRTAVGIGAGLMLEGAAGNPNAHRLPPPNIAKAIRGLADFVDLEPKRSGAPDMAATAAIIAGLARVVTVDTSVAHLAGSMGKPCHILMSRPAVDWYTHWHDDRTLWYPSARLIRQRSSGDWAGVIADLAQTLEAPA